MTAARLGCAVSVGADVGTPERRSPAERLQDAQPSPHTRTKARILCDDAQALLLTQVVLPGGLPCRTRQVAAQLADPDSLPNNPAIHVVDLLLPQARVTVSAVIRCRDSRADGSSA